VKTKEANLGLGDARKSNWESGKYAWKGGEEELREYLDVVQSISLR